MFRYLLLGLLRSRGPLHGYALMKVSRSCSGLTVGSGNFYRELQRLAADGLIAGSLAKGTDPRRVPYGITDRGVVALEAWLAEPKPTAASPHHDELTTRALLIEVSADVTRRGLERCRDELVYATRSLQRALGVGTGATGKIAGATRAIILERFMKRMAVDLEFIERLCELDAGGLDASKDPRRREQPVRARLDRGNGAAIEANGS